MPNICFAGNHQLRYSGSTHRSLRKVISELQCYGEKIQVISNKNSSAGPKKSAPIRILVKVSDQDRLIAFFQNPKGLPFHDVHVQNNLLKFHHHSQEFLVENLSPVEFAHRARQIRRSNTAVV